MAPIRPTRRRQALPQDDLSDDAKARLFLALACVWPLVVMALFSASSPGASSSTHVVAPGKTIRNILDRVDVLGYGPTHPRVAVVVVGDNPGRVTRSVESVFRNTDRNRLFVVCAVMDGVKEDEGLVSKLNTIDEGYVPHWHGLRPHVHLPQANKEAEEEPHSRKVHVIFSKEKQGIWASRSDAVDFINILSKKHEEAGVKAQEEDLILLLLQEGAELDTQKWLTPITSALIVPPPILSVEDNAVALKLANAVSFSVERPSQRTSFDLSFKKQRSDASATDMALSNGNSYPTPALAGAATALRLETYLDLPAQDMSLRDQWAADLDLSLNLWLCADGIDILRGVGVQPDRPVDYSAKLTPEQAARFAAAWMDDAYGNAVYQALSGTISRTEWDELLASAKDSPLFSSGLQHKCRSFSWFAEKFDMDHGIEPPKIAEGKVGNAKGAKADSQASNGKLPSKPLDPARLEIISKATPVDITYVDVANGHKEHPHMGAKDENGNWGYIHDEKALRLNPPSFEFEHLQRACSNHDNHYNMLTKKIIVDMEAHEAAEKSGRKRDKIFCLVYTIESGHPRIPNIRETWGQKCDGFMVGSTKTDRALGTVEIPHEGPEEYNNIWQKVRSMWSYVYDNYYDEYDWFHIGGDDLYLIVENLRLYLESEEIKLAANGGHELPTGNEKMQTPLFLGRRFAYQGDMNEIFNSGGSGYTMNKAALKALVVDGFPNYFPHLKTFSEDTMVARIFRKMGVFPYDTKDEAGGERYMPFLPGHHLGYRMPKDKSKDWYAMYSIDIKFGLDHCAARSVAFHYVKDDMMKRMHAILYNHCP